MRDYEECQEQHSLSIREREVYIKDLCKILGLTLNGNDVLINGLNFCDRSSIYKNIISYATNTRYIDTVKKNDAVKCLIVNECDYEEYQKNLRKDMSFIVTVNPEKTFYDIHNYLYYKTKFYNKYEFESSIGENCNIHKSVVIEDGVIIGNNVSIGPNSVIKKGTIIEDNVNIGCNSSIGCDGFQMPLLEGKRENIVHVGRVHICRDASIDNNVNIDKSLFENETYVGDGTKIDALVYIAHGVHIDKNVIVTAGTILAGSCIIKENSYIGINSSIICKTVVGKNSKIGMGSVVVKDIGEHVLAYGVPAHEKSNEERKNE